MIQFNIILSTDPNEARTPAATFRNCFEVVLRKQLGLALVLLALFCTCAVKAQEQPQHPFFRNDPPEKIESAVHLGLNELWGGKDHNEILTTYPEAKGTVEFEIVLKRKGIVESVRKKDSTIDDLKFMNDLQHLIFDTKFDFKLQKGNTHKMTYTYSNL